MATPARIQRNAVPPRRPHIAKVPIDLEEAGRHRAAMYCQVVALFESTQGPLHSLREIAALLEEEREEIARRQKRIDAAEERRSELQSEAACYLDSYRLAWRRFTDADARVVAAHGESAFDSDIDGVSGVPDALAVNVSLLDEIGAIKTGDALVKEFLARVGGEAGTRPGWRSWPKGAKVSKLDSEGGRS